MAFAAKDFPNLFPSKAIPRRTVRREDPPAATWQPLARDALLLAIDPSIANCGWAIVRNTWPNTTRIDSGIFHPVERADRNRHDHLSDLIRQRVELAEDGLTHAIVETPAGGPGWSGAASLMVYARSIGVCEATCHCLGMRVHRVQVNVWKGKGKKERTQLQVKHFFKYTPRDDNEADALGLGLWLCGKTIRPTTSL